MSDTTPTVRGRDFTGYRIGGAIAALLLLLALGWQVLTLFDGETVTVPESQWRLSEESGAYASEMTAHEILTARTRLMDERFRTGPSPGAEAPDLAMGTEHFLTEGPLEGDGRRLTQNWLRADDAALQMAPPSERAIGIPPLP